MDMWVRGHRKVITVSSTPLILNEHAPSLLSQKTNCEKGSIVPKCQVSKLMSNTPCSELKIISFQ